MSANRRALTVPQPQIVVVSSISVFLLLLLFSRKSSCADDFHFKACVPKSCGDIHDIRYPFWIQGRHEPFCGVPSFNLSCDNTNRPIFRLKLNNGDFVVHQIFYHNSSILVTAAAADSSSTPGCGAAGSIENVTIVEDKFKVAPDQGELFLLFNCPAVSGGNVTKYELRGCGDGKENVLAMFGENPMLGNASRECRKVVAAPVDAQDGNGSGEAAGEWEYYRWVLRRGFLLKWFAPDCGECEETGGRCGFDEVTHRSMCYCPDRPHYISCPPPSKGKSILKLAAGIGSATIFILIVCSILYIVWRRYRQKYASSDFIFTNPPDPSTKSGPGDCFYFGVPVFTYSELQEATYNFDPARELGDGGFGTVYHGKLRDGREVAVKRLYEKSYKRVEQFMNEIEILTRLRHQNLVTLYGCTSRYSRELLLVYEFIPKGTVADHLHGDQATPSSLPWPVRLRIAIETASALAYLHASDIIHRDVKTNNILLDNNFGVKVADFGLSRLFPNDVTHVSTAPQGTPGYVDPEYHQCYQLTEKSDVYSFGVVLIELISSMPAVDIFRQNHEINLANLAVNKIQNQAFGELVDPCLGFESDLAVRRMTISAAELAFQCLQLDREARPSMVEVLKVLMIIESEQGNVEKTEDAHDTAGAPLPVVPPPASPESDNVVLLKRMHLPTSPGTVMEKWASRSTTTTASG
ncbi:LEAF RUST 10 DISEASE-RESISTANCE LOCUS RECEPTOR-LIKE PROTEIN KINASE-like 1.2 isoform X1 [Malania oleifera]|uniref:LEAF RUST 10 DISEASE-RESISTANCE LOCUS RECEPTOR-LIKE PROTEIN KINASE-like 1.2 isoform X1 n=1 Tax=Malania oleifera TaxID=397392 RepID=UPI0025AE5990|nr:LEAF RUST 10 DISEASE-RESISTANCE LOCUS RECEPTOR-LIKE PROTEIN KINASE-like 1.2 isoform X1 [Malania oleifera]